MHEIRSTGLLKSVMTGYFRSLEDPGRKIAWCTSVGPAELLRSFGFEVYFPENHGALLGASRTATDFIPVAGKQGYSNHVCSYTTSDIGSYLSGKSPLRKHYGIGGPPRPDLIVYNTNQCREVEDWFGFYARAFSCPVVGIHPPRHLDTVTRDEVDLVERQHRALLPVCEAVSRKPFDPDAFRETVRLSREATLLWQRALRTAGNVPAPIGFFDAVIHMGPIVVLRGTPAARDYYRALVDELENAVANGTGMLDEERVRLFWDGMPIWGRNRMLSELFLSNHAAVVASTYCNSWIFDAFDENDPFRSTARAYTEIFINRSEEAKMKMLAGWLEEYRCDGIVFHDAKTCFNNSNTRFGMPLRLKERTGVPSLVIEGDLCDLRFFSEAQSTTKVEAFLEQLEGMKESMA